MFIEIVFWLYSNGDPAPDKFPHLPPAADVKRFPSQQECAEQKARWQRHVEWLEQMESSWPESRERFAAWKEQASHAAFLWDVLREAAEVGDWHDEESKRSRLNRYRWWVGEKNYRQAWRPPELPESLHADRVVEAPKMADGR